MEYIKLQIGCLAIIFFIIFLYLREVGINKNRKEYSLFTSIYITAILLIIFDGITSYTVNHLDTVNHQANIIFHLCYYICIQMLIFLMYLYILSITEGIPTKISQKIFLGRERAAWRPRRFRQVPLSSANFAASAGGTSELKPEDNEKRRKNVVAKENRTLEPLRNRV